MQIWINADDYGWNESCSLAIFEAFERGWLTTTTACANGVFFDEAVKLVGSSNHREKIGLHLNLTEGIPLTECIKACDRLCINGHFYGFPSRQIPLSNNQRSLVYSELYAQAKKYIESGMSLNHIDSHHFIHNSIAAFSLCIKVSEEFNCKRIRRFRNVGSISFIKRMIKNRYNRILDEKGLLYSHYFGSVEDYFSFQSEDHNTVFEIMVHPDFDSNGVLIDRENSDYSNPIGKPLEQLIEEVNRRGDTIL